MTSPSPTGDPVAEAYRLWWDSVAAKGDPMRVPNLSRKAFAAGFEAARAAPRVALTEEQCPPALAQIKPRDDDAPTVSQNQLRRLVDGLERSARRLGLIVTTDAHGGLFVERATAFPPHRPAQEARHADHL